MDSFGIEMWSVTRVQRDIAGGKMKRRQVKKVRRGTSNYQQRKQSHSRDRRMEPYRRSQTPRMPVS